MALYTKNDQEIEAQYSLPILNTPSGFLPMVITSNLRILISTPTTQGSAVIKIFPDEATSSSPLQQPFHILRLPPACSATARYFHLPLYYEDHAMTVHVSLDKANHNTVNISAPYFSHCKTPWESWPAHGMADY